jgi:AraC-like DNA-binding protein
VGQSRKKRFWFPASFHSDNLTKGNIPCYAESILQLCQSSLWCGRGMTPFDDGHLGREGCTDALYTTNARSRVGMLSILQARGSGGVACKATIADSDEEELFTLVLQRHGACTVEQDGRQAKLQPGDMALYSSAREHELACSGAYAQTMLNFPAEPIRALCPHIDELTATGLERDAPGARLLVAMADAMVQIPFEHPDARSSQHAAQAAAQLLAATLAQCAPAAERRARPLSAFHVARIKQYIASNLHDSALSVATVSAALKISRAHIHRIFASEPYSFSEWIWHQRLLACKAALLDPAQAHATVSQIAYSTGFNNMSHFSRAFRTKFGVSPTTCRS